ncbi:ribosomal RNA-processing protein 7-domain-containing protein [Panaeolus papilionaceus]|nr:ribosomal RNA-processing protein 7-domain-containing protein [Panaeolus papilionaceus]
MAIPSNVSGFTVIPITYNQQATHYLYARRHASSKSDSQKLLPEGRTLFLVNVPPDASERDLVLFFKHSGTVEKTIFDFDVKEPQNEESDSEEDDEDEEAKDGEMEGTEQPRKRRRKDKVMVPTVVPLPTRPLRKLRKTGRSAHVIFLDTSSLERALASTSKPRAWPSAPEEPSGLSHYQALYELLRPPADSIKAHVDSSIELYDYEVAKKKQKSKYKKGEAIVDEDGFTVVTRGGAYGKTLGGGVGVASKRFQRSGESGGRNRGNKKEKKEKEGFYSFQKAEKQRSELMELKRKWEEDKAKVDKLKASRSFKPY